MERIIYKETTQIRTIVSPIIENGSLIIERGSDNISKVSFSGITGPSISQQIYGWVFISEDTDDKIINYINETLGAKYQFVKISHLKWIDINKNKKINTKKLK